jgi:hypothetical protein
MDERARRPLQPDVATATSGGEREASDGLDRRQIRIDGPVGVADERARLAIQRGLGAGTQLIDRVRRKRSAGHLEPAGRSWAPLGGVRATMSRWLGQPETSGTGLHPQRRAEGRKLIGQQARPRPRPPMSSVRSRRHNGRHRTPGGRS